MKRQDVFVRQPLPDRYQFPKNLLRLPEILRGKDSKGFEGNILMVPSSPPNIGGPTGSNGGSPAFFEPLE
jgi:hypothetical protein